LPQEAVFVDIHFFWRIRVRVVEAIHISAVRRHVDNSVLAGQEKMPKVLRIRDATGKTATDTDDCYGLVHMLDPLALPHPVT